MEDMSSLGMVRSMEIVEVNPILDVRNDTAAMAVALAARILGENFLVPAGFRLFRAVQFHPGTSGVFHSEEYPK